MSTFSIRNKRVASLWPIRIKSHAQVFRLVFVGPHLYRGSVSFHCFQSQVFPSLLLKHLLDDVGSRCFAHLRQVIENNQVSRTQTYCYGFFGFLNGFPFPSHEKTLVILLFNILMKYMAQSAQNHPLAIAFNLPPVGLD